VEANISWLPDGCSIIWNSIPGGSVAFSNKSGTTATATFTTSGANLYITAKTSCQQYTSGWSSPFTVVEVVGVIAYPEVACVGQNVTFGALTNPPNSAHLVTVGWYTTPEGNPAMGAGSQFTTNWSTPGIRTATAICGTSNAQKDVGIIDVVIDTPSSFPAYVTLGDSLALGCTPLGVTGGSYSWSKVSGPGSVTFTPSAGAEDPSFSANQSGNYTVKVQYTKGGASVSDTSGTISVFASPVAILEYSASTYIGRGETIYFDGSGSFDPDGGDGGLLRGIKKFEWDWDNNGTYDYQENPGDGIASHSFTTGGTKTVTMRVTDNDAAEGGPPDKSATDSVTFQVCSKPHAEYTSYAHWEPEDGVLLFRYLWSSTNGVLSDLDGNVGEFVTYPGYPSVDPYYWPNPPWNCATPNPTHPPGEDASDGEIWDTHGTGTFITPYNAASFSASQNYGFHCNACMPSGTAINLLGPHSIDRQVYWVNPPVSTWRYRIDKTGVSAEKNLP
jgi:hypothetical protein